MNTKNMFSYENKVLRVHTLLLVGTIAVPIILLMVGIISARQCFSLFGVGFFMISGHTFAFFDAYSRYLKSVEAMKQLSDDVIRKMLRTSVVLDMAIAIFFYMLGNQ